MDWDKTYDRDKRVWGNQPSELALFACRYFASDRSRRPADLVDLGCGYGRDAIHISRHLDCRVTGIDNSAKAIEIAASAGTGAPEGRLKFLCCDFTAVSGHYDTVLAANLYQILRPDERAALRETVRRILKPQGLLFLSTLSVRDPEHYGKGRAVAGDPNSFEDEKYLHLSTREEIEADFGFLDIITLVEHDYLEPRSNGETHHHISWLMAGCANCHSGAGRNPESQPPLL